MERYILIFLFLLVFVLVNVLTWIMIGGIRVPKHDEPMTWTWKPTSDNDVIANMPMDIKRDILSGTFAGMTDPSFEMRENIDFLLTPGILVQQCISEDVLITYPEE